MSCALTASAVQQFLAPLQGTQSQFASVWADSMKKAPTRAGKSFGSCYSVCGSVGISNVDDLENLQLDTVGPNVLGRLYFSQCAIQDYALILLQIQEEPLNVHLSVRATGGLDNDAISIGPQGTHATFSGFLLITIPVKIEAATTTFRFSDCTVDASLQARFADLSYFQTNAGDFFNSLPIESTLSEYISTLNAYLKTEIPWRFRKLLQASDASVNCTVPASMNQTCASLVSPTSGCDICDTCCKCTMQQRCDNECESCPCVSCSSPILGSIFMFTCVGLVLVFIVFYLIIRFK